MRRAKEISVIYEILGPGKEGLRIFACAVCQVEYLLFSEHVPMDDIRVTKDVYPQVAFRMNKSSRAVARQVERMGNQFWNCMDEAQKKQYIRKALKDIRAPRDILYYLAFYIHFHQSFYQFLEKQPALLFGHCETCRI